TIVLQSIRQSKMGSNFRWYCLIGQPGVETPQGIGRRDDKLRHLPRLELHFVATAREGLIFQPEPVLINLKMKQTDEMGNLVTDTVEGHYLSQSSVRTGGHRFRDAARCSGAG